MAPNQPRTHGTDIIPGRQAKHMGLNQPLTKGTDLMPWQTSRNCSRNCTRQNAPTSFQHIRHHSRRREETDRLNTGMNKRGPHPRTTGTELIPGWKALTAFRDNTHQHGRWDDRHRPHPLGTGTDITPRRQALTEHRDNSHRPYTATTQHLLITDANPTLWKTLIKWNTKRRNQWWR